jgi:hypothetical protein
MQVKIFKLYTKYIKLIEIIHNLTIFIDSKQKLLKNAIKYQKQFNFQGFSICTCKKTSQIR